MSIKGNVRATYLGSGGPALTGYYPAWLDNLADDATVEGSLLDPRDRRGGTSLTLRRNPVPESTSVSHGSLQAHFAPPGRRKSN